MVPFKPVFEQQLERYPYFSFLKILHHPDMIFFEKPQLEIINFQLKNMNTSFILDQIKVQSMSVKKEHTIL